MQQKLKQHGLALLFVFAIVATGCYLAWPIYQTWYAIVVAAAAALLGAAIQTLFLLKKPAVMMRILVVLLGLLLLVPISMPALWQHLPESFTTGMLDGIAALVLGWKQLLTLSLPVGEYQTVLVPLAVVSYLTAFLACLLATTKRPYTAAFPALLPLLFATFFGQVFASPSVGYSVFILPAPYEFIGWLITATLLALWVRLTADRERRLRLRRGAKLAQRGSTSDAAENTAAEQTVKPVEKKRGGAIGGILFMVVSAILVTALAAPYANGFDRRSPRQAITPEVLDQLQLNLLSAYRSSKTDTGLKTELFRVESNDKLPERMRLAVLNEYTGTDFRISADTNFGRFPSGVGAFDSTQVTVTMGSAYSGVWAPISPPLGSTPSFDGPNATALSKSFYSDGELGAALAIGDGAGLTRGDSYTIRMSHRTDTEKGLVADPRNAKRLDDKEYPELTSWIADQEQPANGAGYTELLQRLRARGYLSHALQNTDGSDDWLNLNGQKMQFYSSPAGHSAARVEKLFEQLNDQASSLPENAPASQYVAAIGDDEQFATAAALIAQALGYDARVVIGTRLSGADTAVPSCDNGVCTGANLAAWVEVSGVDGKWVSFDVTPQTENPPMELSLGQQFPEFPTVPEERNADQVEPPLGNTDEQENNEEAAADTFVDVALPYLRAASLALLGILLLLLPLLFIPMIKRLTRRKRKREQVPSYAAIAAWDELRDRAIDAGVIADDNTTRPTQAAVIGTPTAVYLAAVADWAAFAKQRVTKENAEVAWQIAEKELSERDREIGRWQRLKEAYSLRRFKRLKTLKTGVKAAFQKLRGKRG